MTTPYLRGLVWFRRDLRDYDHAALYHALKLCGSVAAVFVFDRRLLAPLPADDRRVSFIHASVAELKAALQARGGDLLVLDDDPVRAIPALAQRLGAKAVFANHDDEPYALQRDAAVAEALAALGIRWHSYKDHLIFERDEILTQKGSPFTVFTPYSRRWRERLEDFFVQSYPVQRYWSHLATVPASPLPSLAELGFIPQALAVAPGMSGAAQLWARFVPQLAQYAAARDYPARAATSGLSVHLRFGTLSIRELVAVARSTVGAEVWLNELIWREFYAQILAHFPQVVQHSFKPQYRSLVFPNPPGYFEAWCAGRTGYPLVDAAMRALAATGLLHNRLRMLVASFLVKDLLVDWRQGEAWFAAQLLDFELASNNGGWQWAASTGCDAQPYFRIFNPLTQSEKFDPEGEFIRRWLPELQGLDRHAIHAPWQAAPLTLQAAGVVLGRDYPWPLVEHGVARQAALQLFGREA